MQSLHIHLSVDETNLILEALGNLPFAKVYGLVANIQQQASTQLATPGADAGSMTDLISPELETGIDPSPLEAFPAQGEVEDTEVQRVS